MFITIGVMFIVIYITCICLDLNLFCLLRRVSFYQC